MNNLRTAFLASEPYRTARDSFLEQAKAQSQKVTGLRNGTGDSRKEYEALIQKLSDLRGRGLFFPLMVSGLGNGALVELLDGSVKWDMITGIGVNFFGHSHPALLEEQYDALTSNVMQGNLAPGTEVHELLEAVLSRVGSKSRIKKGWVIGSGTMANEIALKIIRQKKAPATKIFAFDSCFSGRSTAMQEITDNPKFRNGQPLYDFVSHLPFYDPESGVEKSVERTITELKKKLKEEPGQYAGLMIELVQGEGGFRFAPKEFYREIFSEAKKQGLAIWVDEVQTFARTGEVFACQKFGVEEFPDVVTVGKALQACAALYTEEYNPKPGLVAGTFCGSTVALRSGRRILEELDRGQLGPDGHIAKLSRRFEENFNRLAEGSCKGLLGERRILGGLVAFQPHDGSADAVKKTVLKLYDLGVITFSCGRGPFLIRMLPPLPAMSEADVDEVCGIIERGLKETA